MRLLDWVRSSLSVSFQKILEFIEKIRYFASVRSPAGGVAYRHDGCPQHGLVPALLLTSNQKSR
jgi:hypothetical protein